MTNSTTTAGNDQEGGRQRRGGGASVEANLAAAAAPYVGISSGGAITPGLFSIESTGLSLAPVSEAAEAFLASLSPEQRAATVFPIDTIEWRKWSNIHRTIMRHGMCFMDMDDDQVDLAFGLLAESMSIEGFETALDVMKLNYTIGEMTGSMEEFGDQRYWLSIMGTPSETEPWGWQMDGHHLNVNFFVLGDQVVMTPTFMGSEPTYAEEGKYAGTRVFATEEQTGLMLMRSLTKEQQAKAIAWPEATRGEVKGTAYRDNFELAYEGVGYAELRPVQQRLMLDIIKAYTNRMRPGHAEVKLEEVKQHLAQTHFAWIGSFGDDPVFYYRIHSPVVLIEFDHQRGTALPSEVPSRNHIHTVVRTPNGNDYGKDLLRQHLEQHHHAGAAPHSH